MGAEGAGCECHHRNGLQLRLPSLHCARPNLVDQQLYEVGGYTQLRMAGIALGEPRFGRTDR